jgi:dipeptidyl aminopeptidase/acylaminoacyl peptidase
MFRRLIIIHFGLILTFAHAAAQTASTFAKIVDRSTVVTDPAQIVSVSKFDIQPLTPEKLYMTRQMGDSAWSPDGNQIAFISNISGRDNLWIVPAAGGWPTQLTVSDQRQTAPRWSPKGRWIAYTSDTDGNELFDIFLVSPRDGQVINLTNTKDVSEDSPAWSPDGEKLAYSSKSKNASSREIDTIEVAIKKITHLTSETPKEWSNADPIWSKDGKWIVFTRRRADFKDSSVFLVASTGGKPINMTPHAGEHIFEASDISPDGKTVLITSNADSGYSNAALLDVAGKKITWLTREKWEVTAGKFSPDGKQVTWTSNVDGNVEVFTYNLASASGGVLPLPKGVNGVAGADTPFSPDGTRLLFAHEGANAPNDLWIYNFSTRKAQQITNSLVGGVRSEDMAEPFLVHYPSKDGKWQISAFVYVPYNAERNGKNAAVVSIHGGPAAQMQNYFIRSIQYLTNQGFFVIAPNYRGSTGYGKEFQDANRFDMGGGDLDDIVSAADWMVKTGYIDPKKIAVMGGSYGGYLTMMAVTRAPERWAAATPWIPFVNWFTEIENTDPAGREHAISTMGNPMKDSDKQRLRDRSPIYFVDHIKAPVLLLAGANDRRCPANEAEQVASAIKKRGGVAELKIYDNEGHGFSRVENQIDAITRIADFLKKYAPPEKCGCNLNEP